MVIIQIEDRMFIARSASEILDEIRQLKGLSSDSALGEIFGVKQTTVSSWRARNSLPYEEIIAFCFREGISTDSLLLSQKPAKISKERGKSDGYGRWTSITVALDDLFTTRLKMELRGRSVEWLAAESSIDATRIEKIVSDRELPTIDELKAIADVLKVNMIWLAQRSSIPSENWDYEFYKKDDKTMFPAEIVKAYLLATESYIERMGGLIKLSQELKADVITIACRVHMKETPHSSVVNLEMLKSLVRLAEIAGPDKISIWR